MRSSQLLILALVIFSCSTDKQKLTGSFNLKELKIEKDLLEPLDSIKIWELISFDEVSAWSFQRKLMDDWYPKSYWEKMKIMNVRNI